MRPSRAAILGIATLVVVGGWYAFRPERAFIDKRVNEPFQEPMAEPMNEAEPMTDHSPMTDDARTMEPPRVTDGGAMNERSAMPDEAMKDGAPMTDGEPVAASAVAKLVSGEFKSVAHETRGTATIYRNPDGTRTLRLAHFETSNGPDVRVYLVAAGDARNADDVKRAGFVELGVLKGNIGDQNYAVPADIDLTKYRAVTIWCKRFSVNFATAPLSRVNGVKLMGS